MKSRVLIVGTLLGVLGACATKPSAPRPAPSDVVVMKHRVWLSNEKAKAGCYFSRESVDQITIDEAGEEDDLNVLATAAGISTTVAAETSLQTVARATGRASK